MLKKLNCMWVKYATNYCVFQTYKANPPYFVQLKASFKFRRLTLPILVAMVCVSEYNILYKVYHYLRRALSVRFHFGVTTSFSIRYGNWLISLLIDFLKVFFKLCFYQNHFKVFPQEKCTYKKLQYLCYVLKILYWR